MIWLALASCAAWAVLIFGRGLFWLARDDDRDADTLPGPSAWPAIAAIIPARNEAATIALTVASLRAQDYPGRLTITVVDDRSTDGTGALAGGAQLVTGGARPPGWTGKLNALRQGLEAVAAEDHTLILFTDADIVHAPESLRMLVRRAHQGFDLVSLMARLRCDSPAERWLVPAFVHFFQMLYPFRWVRDPAARTAGAAGGCVLLRRDTFEAAGGLHPIRGRIIDDCALAALVKGHGGRLWLGLTERVHSLRAYPAVADLRAMVARTAYAQLGYSPWRLAAMVAAMALVFLAPPLLAFFGEGAASWLGLAAWAAMTFSFMPMLRCFALSPWRAVALPLVAATYLAFTLDSARAEWRGQGGLWKGEPLSRR